MSNKHETFQLRYTGNRFKDARLPLEVISDLPAFRDLLVSYAKDRWRSANLRRKRLPRGFDKSISLDLVSLEEGSAVPTLKRSRDIEHDQMMLGFADNEEDLIDKSFDDICQLFDDAGNNRFPEALSSEHIRALNRLGAGLLKGERIEFLGSQGSDGNVVYLDLRRRKALITRVRETYEMRYEGVGTLIGLHVDGFIDVDTTEHGALRLRVHPDRVRCEFDGNIGSEVQFAAQIELDNNDSFRNVIEVYDVELIDAELSENLMLCHGRLDELARIEPGWHHGSGEAMVESAIKAAKTFIDRRPQFANAYRLYPTEAGGVLCEFDVSGWDFSIEFGADGSVEMYGVEIDGSGEMEPKLFNEMGGEFIRVFDDRTRRER
jgi:hypothetical protein